MFFFFTQPDDGQNLRRFMDLPVLRRLLARRFTGDVFDGGSALLIYDTRLQRTWLITSTSRLFCVIDRRKDSTPKVVWSRNLDDFSAHDSHDVAIQVEDVSSEFGTLRIGQEKPRKFSASLFSAAELRRGIMKLLGKHVVEQAST